jgi:hypothetical protein
VLLIAGTIVPLLIGTIYALRGLAVPQCPTGYTQAQIDSSDCIIGANMSGVYIFLAVPYVLMAVVSSTVWMVLIWRKRQRISDT